MDPRGRATTNQRRERGAQQQRQRSTQPPLPSPPPRRRTPEFCREAAEGGLVGRNSLFGPPTVDWAPGQRRRGHDGYSATEGRRLDSGAGRGGWRGHRGGSRRHGHLGPPKRSATRVERRRRSTTGIRFRPPTGAATARAMKAGRDAGTSTTWTKPPGIRSPRARGRQRGESARPGGWRPPARATTADDVPYGVVPCKGGAAGFGRSTVAAGADQAGFVTRRPRYGPESWVRIGR